MEENIIFDCSFCGHKWIPQMAKKYSKKVNNYSWTEYKSICPECGRETTAIKDNIENVSKEGRNS